MALTPNINSEYPVMFTREQLGKVLELMEGDIQSTHNHIASALESPQDKPYVSYDTKPCSQYVQELVQLLREKQERARVVRAVILRADGIIG